MADWKWLVVCGALAARGALAQDDAAGEADAADTEAPRWSVGAGVTYGGAPLWYGMGGVGAIGLGGYYGPSEETPAPPYDPSFVGLTPRLSMEYQLTPGLALALEALATYSRASPGGTELRPTDRMAALGLGLRGVVLRRGATRVLLHGLVHGATLHSEYLMTRYVSETGFYETVLVEESQLSAQLAGGLAVERELLDTLSVRVGADVASVGWSRLKQQHPRLGERQASLVTAQLLFAPHLELRLAF